LLRFLIRPKPPHPTKVEGKPLWYFLIWDRWISSGLTPAPC